MANSKIIINFSAVPNIDDIFSFRETLNAFTFAEIFKEVRTASNQTKVPGFIPDDGTHGDRWVGFISTNYKTAFNLDFNISGLFTVTYTTGALNSGIGTVTITANYPNAVFEEITTPFGIDVTIVNEMVNPVIKILSTDFTQADTMPCKNVKLGVTTDLLAINVVQPISIVGNTDNPFFIDLLRGQTYTVEVQDIYGHIVAQSVRTPDLLNIANFNFNLNNSPAGATLTVSDVNNSTYGLVLEYSLDNVTWQSSNVFSGLAVDDYTIYVRDQLGCGFDRAFSVTEFGIYTPYFYISKSNAITFAQRVDWGDAINYKTDENTLSFEVDTKVKYKEIQQFQSADVITTQFKSNYTVNTATVIKSDLTTVSVPVVQKTTNIGNKDKRDAVKFNAGNGMTGIYFQSGNIYDYALGTVTDTYALNGYLPYWAKVAGNYVAIGSAWYLIEAIIFDEVRNCEAILFSEIYTGADTPVIVSSIFNIKDYEVYEFSIDMLDYLNENFSVQIDSTDPHFIDLVHLSEEINVKVKQENTVEIRYNNTTNTDIFYSTDIVFKIRQEVMKVNGFSIETTENYKTDSNAILLNADVYEADEFQFEPVTKEIMRKIVRALSHDNLYINEVGYVKNDNVELEGPLEDSNLYLIKAKMIKNGNVYNSQSAIGDDIVSGSLQTVGLVDYGGGFIRY